MKNDEKIQKLQKIYWQIVTIIGEAKLTSTIRDEEEIFIKFIELQNKIANYEEKLTLNNDGNKTKTK